MAEAATPRPFSHYVSELGLIGEINNQVYDRNGEDRTSEIPGFGEHVINILSLDDIKSLASDHASTKVVAVATGDRKITAIRVALQAGFANVLITGRADAIRLLEEPGPESPRSA